MCICVNQRKKLWLLVCVCKHHSTRVSLCVFKCVWWIQSPTALSITDGANMDASMMILPTPVGAKMIVWDLGRAGEQNEARIRLVNEGQWLWHAAVRSHIFEAHTGHFEEEPPLRQKPRARRHSQGHICLEISQDMSYFLMRKVAVLVLSEWSDHYSLPLLYMCLINLWFEADVSRQDPGFKVF